MRKLILIAFIAPAMVNLIGCTTPAPNNLSEVQTVKARPPHRLTPEEKALLEANKAKMLEQQRRGDKFVQ